MSVSHTESERSSADGLASAQRRLREMALRASQSSLGIPSRLAPSAIIERIVQSFCFELFFGVLIALQAVVMAVEAHYQSIATAEDLGYERHRGSPGGDWDGAEDVFHMLELTFGVLFSMELLLRVFGLRESFMYDPWNWFDVAIVTLWVMSKFESVLPVSPQLVRLTRFARLARLLKLVRMIQGFDSLIVLTTSIRSSAGILAWSGFCLLLVMIFNALVLNGLLTEFYFRRETFPISERLEIFRYFGSFTSSLFSMFELTLANWPPISRALYENVSGWFILVTLVHKFTVGFAVIGIINGVFIQETFRVAQQDDEIMLRRGEKAMCIHANKMKRLVETADSSGEGVLDIGEFRLMFQDPGIKAWLGSMELNPRDVDSLFAMMDDGDGYLSVDEVIRGVGLYKGAARSIDLHMLAQEHRKLQAVVLRLHYNVLSRLGKSDDGLQDTSLSRLGQSDDDIDI